MTDSIVEVIKQKEEPKNIGQTFIQKQISQLDSKSIMLIIIFIVELAIGVIEGFLTKKCE